MCTGDKGTVYKQKNQGTFLVAESHRFWPACGTCRDISCLGSFGCSPVSEQTVLLQKLSGKVARKFAYHPAKSAGEEYCVSCPFLHLLGGKIDFIGEL